MPVDGEKWLFERVGRDDRIRDRFMSKEPVQGSGTENASLSFRRSWP